MNVPAVSVIIPVYNGEKFIDEALESVYAQTFRDFEVVVVNDGSTDNTERRLQMHGGRIKYISQSNQGQSVARREGIRHSSGKLVAFLDADDLWLPHKLEQQVSFTNANPRTGLVSTDVSYFRDDHTVLSTLKEWHEILNGDVLERLLFDNWIPPSAALVRRECFERVTTFDVPPPCFGEDWMMWMEIAAYYPVHFIDKVLVRRRIHLDSMSNQSDEVQFRCLLRNLQIMGQRIPQLVNQPELVREASFRICFRRGLGDLRALRLLDAREKLLRALSFRPNSIKSRMLLIGTYVPAPLLQGTKRVAKRIKGMVDRTPW